jgi:hypothetical protein
MLLKVHVAAAVLFVATIVYQVFLAGQAIANLGGSGDFSSHISFGFGIVGLAALAVLVTALVARRPRRDIGISAGMFVLYIVQTFLPGAKESAPWIAALHPVNAMILFGLSVWYARKQWLAMSAGSAAGA